jgi:prefoldin subunit 5
MPELLKERKEYWEKAREVFNTEITKLKEKLEDEFREILGVRQKEENKIKSSKG